MRRARLLAMLLVCGVLAACAGVPTSGPIEQGPVVDSAESTQFIRVIAAPPSAGAAPQEIVRGFLEAHASLEQDHAIARHYLTAAASEAWKPQASTLIYDQATLTTSRIGERTVRARFTAVATLSTDGTLLTLDQPEKRQVTYSLQQTVDGQATGEAALPQWRIADPPDGILISTTDLRRAYRLHQTFFASDRASVLVPDGRMLPVVGASLPTTLAEAVLAGPSAWLAPGVRGSLPAGTSLALGAVPVVDGVASVELTNPILTASDQQRRDLGAAMTWTLTEIPDIVAVQLLVDGEPLAVPGVPTVMDRTSWQALDPDPLAAEGPNASHAAHYLLEGAAVERVSDVSRTTIPIAAPGAEQLLGLAVSDDQRRAAAVEPDGSGLWLIALDRALAETHIPGRHVTSVSFGVDGEVWYTDAGKVRRVVDGTKTAEVAVLTEGIGPVSAIQLARDGTLVALAVDGVVQVGVLQEQQGSPAITSVHRVGWTSSDVTDLAWHDAATLDVLGIQDTETPQVLRLSVGSSEANGLGAPPGPTDVAASPGGRTLVAGADDGIFGNVGLQWRRQDPGRSVAYP